YPTTPLGPDREMFQHYTLQLQGIRSVAEHVHHAQFARPVDDLGRDPEGRGSAGPARSGVRVTNTAWHGTRMGRFNARGGHPPLTGRLYVPQLSSEANVRAIMRKKINQVGTFYGTLKPASEPPPRMMVGSATAVDRIAANTVD